MKMWLTNGDVRKTNVHMFVWDVIPNWTKTIMLCLDDIGPKQVETNDQERCKALLVFNINKVETSSLATSVDPETAAVIIASL